MQTSFPVPEYLALPATDAQCTFLLGTTLLYWSYVHLTDGDEASNDVPGAGIFMHVLELQMVLEQLDNDQLEAFLDIIVDQRVTHLQLRPEISADAVFSDEDMKEIINRWTEEGSSMNTGTATRYNELRHCNQPNAVRMADEMRKSAFNCFLFRIIGNKHLLLAAIKHPVVWQ